MPAATTEHNAERAFPGASAWTPSGAGARIVYAAVALLPLVCFPGEAPFSAPKLWLLASMLPALLAAVFRSPLDQLAGNGPSGWLALGWVTTVSLSALVAPQVSFRELLLCLLPLPLFWSVRRGGLNCRTLAWCLRLGSLVESVIVLLQFCGLDPLRLPGWQPEWFPSPRMRAYGTLGNPDFVAAWCCATLPFTWIPREPGPEARSKRAARFVLPAISIAAIAATGSRVCLLALPVEAAALLMLRARLHKGWLLAPAAALALISASPTRPLRATVEGRLYLAKVSLGEWRRTPPAGHGPGSFEMRFAELQMKRLERDGVTAESARFAGPVDHAHNDYIEFLLEYGPAGVAVFLGFCIAVLTSGWRLRSQPFSGAEPRAAFAGFTGLLAIACVDFPFHRPAEWALFWLCAGMLAAGAKPRSTTNPMEN